MNMSEKMKAMVKVIKENSRRLVDDNDLYKYYIAPDIPQKIINKLMKYYDNHLPANSLLAFFDTTLFGTSKAGFVFTTEGFYYKWITKASYFQYCDVRSTEAVGTNLYVKLNQATASGDSSFTLIDSLEMDVLKKVIDRLCDINAEYGYCNTRSSGKIKKVALPKNMEDKCHAIIHTASVACGGVGTGLAQIPLSDNAVIVPAQIAMIISLGAVFELNITESAAKGIITSSGASIAGRSVSQLLWGWIPIIGNAINTATAAGITELIGWIAVKNFYERWIEDKNKGRFEGMKDGYTEASYEYERKLRKQAEDFLKQIKDVEKERTEYEKLLNDYETYIQELEEKCASQEMIIEMKDILRNLKALG